MEKSGVDPIMGFRWIERWVPIELCYEQGAEYKDRLDGIKESVKRKGLSAIPPVTLYAAQSDPMYRPYVPEGYSYWIRDGHHRIQALKEMGYAIIYARIYDIPIRLRWLKMCDHAVKV